MTRRLNTHPDVAAFGETLFWGRGYQEPKNNGSYTHPEIEEIIERLSAEGLCSSMGEGEGTLSGLAPEGLDALLREALDVPDDLSPAEAFERICMAIARAEGKSIGIEKTTHHINWIHRILAAMPDAKMVVSLREPYGFMLSYKYLALRAEREGRSPSGSYHPVWPPIVWRKILRTALDAKRAYPRNVHLVWLHDIIEHPDEQYRRILEFLELPVCELRAENSQQNTSFPDGQRPCLAAEDLAWMDLLNGRLIQEQGFDRRQTNRKAALPSLARMPRWAFDSFTRMSRISNGSAVSYLSKWFTR